MKKISGILIIPILILVCFAINVSSANASLFKSYTVKFDIYNNKQVETVKVRYNKKVSKPKNPTREGYNFAGWYYDKAYTKKYNFNNKVKSNFTLYAKWNIKSYTITFNSNGGTLINSQKVTYKNKVSVPKNPTKKGYVFKGWYKDLDYESKFSFLTPVRNNITLYAKWVEPGVKDNTHDVTFVTNAGIDPFILEIENGESFDEIPIDLENDDFSYAEWFTDGNMTKSFDITSPITRDMVLYGKLYDSKGDQIIETPDTASLYNIIAISCGVFLLLSAVYIFTTKYNIIKIKN